MEQDEVEQKKRSEEVYKKELEKAEKLRFIEI